MDTVELLMCCNRYLLDNAMSPFTGAVKVNFSTPARPPCAVEGNSRILPSILPITCHWSLCTPLNIQIWQVAVQTISLCAFVADELETPCSEASCDDSASTVSIKKGARSVHEQWVRADVALAASPHLDLQSTPAFKGFAPVQSRHTANATLRVQQYTSTLKGMIFFWHEASSQPEKCHGRLG